MADRNEKAIRESLAREEARLVEIESEHTRVAQRIAELKVRLSSAVHQIGSSEKPLRKAALTSRVVPSTSKEKVALFLDLFRGRTDVYPKRWVNTKKGTKGYSPACANEWVRGVCEKPRVKCGECSNQAFIPVTEKTIHEHFLGRPVIGVYPMLEDETCSFLAVDFDKGCWRDDVAAFTATCRSKDVPFAVERSRSGDGAHVWFFFSSPIPAGVARKMGCYLITETMAQRHELSMASYDRLFPNQDTMPRGGFGNLIALPFQDGPRQQGNSVFVDETWMPYPNQWAFLASIRRMPPSQIEALVIDAQAEGQVLGERVSEFSDDEGDDTPWKRRPSRRTAKLIITEPVPTRVRCVLSQLAFVETIGLPSPLINRIKRLAAFQNPVFYKKQAMRLSTALTPRIISCAEEHPQHIGLPRGCMDVLQELLAELGVALEVDDQRTDGESLDACFQGDLRPIQEQAVHALVEHDFGVFVAPPGSGKTVVGANLVARRGRSTLVLVHRTQLLEQWIAQLSLFLDLKSKEIGQIGGGRRKPNGRLDVAMIQSLARRGEVNDIVGDYGHVIVDECHHVPAVSFERIMREVQARYITGLTATPRRRDGHHPILHLQLGPARFSIDPKSQAAAQPFEHRLIVRSTEFRLASNAADTGIQEVYRQIAIDERRNRLILDDVIRALDEKRSPILLTERRDHLDYFAKHLHGPARNLIVLHGGMKAKDRRAAIQQLAIIPETEERLVLATGRFIGEGFDDARLDTLFLAMPVSWRGTLVQYAGRLHRKHHGKTEVRIMDYVDRDVPMLARMLEKRMRGYRAMGYVVADHVAPEPIDEYVIEYDEGALGIPDGDSF
ncbi:MAG: DEAD/DEAH box helicase family protein [bacterium]|nr:DEAD/DEAH box helicase family protein [bacterium]